ncbi:hypothetical protein BH10ACT11_BH10ACT11_12920 [soil metagenome]
MREKLNENPMMQVVLIGVLIVVVGFVCVSRMGSSSESTTDPNAAATTTPGATTDPAATDPAAASAVPADPTAPVAAADGSIPSAAPAVGTTSSFKAGPGLPKPIVKAYDSGGAVVLFVSKQKGVDDKKMRKVVGSIKGDSQVNLFTIPVHDIAKYSRIAQGVDLNRVPALVVIQPKKLTGKGQAPSATVSYGYRTPNSVKQAVKDQLYDGKVLGYSPK